MSRTLSLIFGLFLVFTAMSPTAFSQGPPEKNGWQFRGGRGRGPMRSPMMDWASRLNLTDEQSARIQELREAYFRDTLPSRNELMVKRFDLRDLLRDPQAEAGAVLAKQREVSELESRIQERAVLFQIEVRRVLTPEQIQLLPPGGGGMLGPPMMPGRGRGRE